LDEGSLFECCGLLFEAHIILRYSYVFLYIYADHFAPRDYSMFETKANLGSNIINVVQKPKKLQETLDKGRPLAQHLMKCLWQFEYFVDR
jgi:hypothetical protein